MKKYWFYLEPYCHLFVQKNIIITYNSLSKSGWKTKIVSKKLRFVIEQLLDLENLYCIELEELDLYDKQISEFVSNVRNSFSGDIIEQSLSKCKPAILVPELRIQDDLSILSNSNFRSIGKDILRYLNEISFYINGGITSSNLLNYDVYKQFDYSTFPENNEIPIKSIKAILSEIRYGSVGRINILGGNIFNYKDFNLLIIELRKVPSTKYFYTHYKDLLFTIQKTELFKDKNYICKILIDFPLQLPDLKNVVSKLRESNINAEFLFAVTSKKEYTASEVLSEQLDLSGADILPVYNGKNLSFFINYVFLSEEEILGSKLNRNDFFLNKTINVFNFGKLCYLPNGKAYANLNYPCLGSLGDPVKKLIYNEICSKTAWFKTRDGEPCCQCVFQFLCPSPSNYESVIGKSNLCNVNLNNCELQTDKY